MTAYITKAREPKTNLFQTTFQVKFPDVIYVPESYACISLSLELSDGERSRECTRLPVCGNGSSRPDGALEPMGPATAFWSWNCTWDTEICTHQLDKSFGFHTFSLKIKIVYMYGIEHYDFIAIFWVVAEMGVSHGGPAIPTVWKVPLPRIKSIFAESRVVSVFHDSFVSDSGTLSFLLTERTQL